MESRNSEPQGQEAQLVALVESYDEALASGSDLTALTTECATVESEFEQIRECLLRLEHAWPRSSTPAIDSFSDTGDAPRRIGRFRIIRELGRGTHGVVLLAYDEALTRRVALKIPRPETLATEDLRHRFRLEGRAAAALDHPNIVPVHEAGQEGAVCFIASAHCDGMTLSDWLRQQEELPPPRTAACILAALADGVQHAHDRGVLHRDIKPNNVLLDPTTHRANSRERGERESEWTPRLTDFGLAKMQEGEDATTTGVILGTPSYMPPEQAQGQVRQIGPAADVYALGATLYEMLTGRPPFKAGAFMETVQQVLSSEPLAPRSFRPNLPRDLETICLKCLEKSPHRRYQSAGALAQDLRRFLAGQAIEGRPVSLVQRSWRTLQRYPIPTISCAFFVVAVGGLLMGVAAYNHRLRQHNAELQASIQREVEAKRESRQQRIMAERQEWRSRRHLYVLQMREAKRAFDTGRSARAVELLNAARPKPGGDDIRGIEWHDLWRSVGAKSFSNAGQGAIYQLAISPNGDKIATAGQAEQIAIWDVRTRTLDTVFSGHDAPEGSSWFGVRCVAFSPNGRTLASGGADATVRLWDLDSSQERAVCKGHLDKVTSVAFSPDGARVASSSDDDSIRIWDAETGESLASLHGHTSNVHSVAFSVDGSRLISCSWDQTVRVWDLRAYQQVRVIRGHEAPVGCVAISPLGRLFVSAASDGTVKIWDLDKAHLIRSLAGHDAKVQSATFSPDGNYLLTGDSDGVIKCWDRQGRELANHRGLVGNANSLAVSLGRGLLAVASGDNSVRLEPLASILGGAKTKHADRSWCVAASPNGDMFATGGEDATIALWDAGRRVRTAVIAGEDAIHGVAFSPDGGLVAGASIDGSVLIHELGAKRQRPRLLGHQARVDAVAFAPRGDILASVSWDKKAKLWDPATGQVLHTLSGHEDDVRCLSMSRNGKLLATGSDDHTIRLWDVKSGECERTLADDYRVRALAFVDSATLISGNARGAVRIWDLTSGGCIVVGKHRQGVRCLAVSPDGLSFVSGGVDETLTFWDLVTNQEIMSLSAPGEVTGVAFSVDGRTLAVSCYDGSIQFLQVDPRD